MEIINSAQFDGQDGVEIADGEIRAWRAGTIVATAPWSGDTDASSREIADAFPELQFATGTPCEIEVFVDIYEELVGPSDAMGTIESERIRVPWQAERDGRESHWRIDVPGSVVDDDPVVIARLRALITTLLARIEQGRPTGLPVRRVISNVHSAASPIPRGHALPQGDLDL